MVRGKTESGFSFKIDDEVRDDMELLENLTRMDAGETQLAPLILESLLGAEQKKKLYEHCRSEKGRVSATKVFAELKSIFEEINKSDDNTKN